MLAKDISGKCQWGQPLNYLRDTLGQYNNNRNNTIDLLDLLDQHSSRNRNKPIRPRVSQHQCCDRACVYEIVTKSPSDTNGSVQGIQFTHVWSISLQLCYPPSCYINRIISSINLSNLILNYFFYSNCNRKSCRTWILSILNDYLVSFTILSSDMWWSNSEM